MSDAQIWAASAENPDVAVLIVCPDGMGRMVVRDGVVMGLQDYLEAMVAVEYGSEEEIRRELAYGPACGCACCDE